MTSSPDIFMTRDAANKIAASTYDHGKLSFIHNAAEDFYRIDVVEIAPGVRSPIVIPPEYTVLGWDGPGFEGNWLKRVSDNVNLVHRDLLRRPNQSLSLEDFRSLVPEVVDPGNQTGFLITYDAHLSDDLRAYGVSEFAGWLVDRSGVRPITLVLEPETIGIAQLDGLWPIAELETVRAAVVGCGSIGGIVADALARFGVGTVHLVDPDRLRWHNLLRHILGPESVGAYKASALSRELGARWPSQDFRAHKVDVVTSAHDIRQLFDEVDIIVCAADGIAARRVVSHLARRAGKPAILACVLADGAVGEVIRLRPTRAFGCLLCLRADLEAHGAIDAEAIQEMDYGTGNVHLPMTAAPPDLHFVGLLAAKVAVATVLESLNGDHTQIVPDEHAIVGLRPSGDLAAPFDTDRAGSIVWRSVPQPRAVCATCNP